MIETQKLINSCNDCGACVKNCEFLSHYCESPRDLAKRFKKNPLENIELLYSCSLCGLCKRVCKLDLSPGDMCLETRQRIFSPSLGDALPEDFVYDYLVPKLYGSKVHQDLSTSPFFALDKGPDSGNGTTPKTVFFPGCSLPAYSSELVIKSYRYLREKMPGVGIVLNCCGKLSNDMGDKERFKKIFDNTLESFSRLGVEEVIVACINCHKMFRENSGIKLRTLYEVMLEKGLPENVAGNGQVVSVHDSCPARNRPEIRKAVRTILSESGFMIEEMQYKNEFTQCCGAGGCAPKGNTALSDRHTRKRVGQATGQLITYCAHCRERFSSYTPSLHVLDLIFSTSSQRHIKEYNDGWMNWFNRWYLKKRIQLTR
ncbi:MAG: heterodisulfide reductase-related iron-sulfur binding cluster [Candidatus Methylomirabilia bacterium]